MFHRPIVVNWADTIPPILLQVLVVPEMITRTGVGGYSAMISPRMSQDHEMKDLPNMPTTISAVEPSLPEEFNIRNFRNI